MSGEIVDARGKRCPLPIIELAQALKIINIGESLTLLSDDPATVADLTAWARMTRNEVEQEGDFEFLVTRLN
ncbi:MAG: sulfurtransferase TusA family protein [Actinomycetes bacterium]